MISGLFKAIKAIFIKFIDDSCLVRASGLAYSSLLAIVPFTTVIYAFGGFDSIGQTLSSLVIDSLVPSQQEVIHETLNNFTRNSLATGTLGMIFFLLTTLFLINTIARNLDMIWGVQVQAGLFRRFTTYTAILVFSSLLLGISNSITDGLETYISNLVLSGAKEYEATMNWFMPFFITLVIFFLIIIIIPSVKIKIKSAAIGALFSAIFFEIIKTLFQLWAVSSVRNSVIYGSLAIIPMVLLGLYLFWLIVLIGVEISFYVQHKYDPSSGDPVNLNMEDKLALAFDIFFKISSNYRNQKGGINIKELEKTLHVPGVLINHFISIFREHQIILEVNDKHGGFIPGQSLDRVELKDLLYVIYGSDSKVNDNDPLALACAKSFTHAGYKALYKGSILDLLNNDNGVQSEENT